MLSKYQRAPEPSSHSLFFQPHCATSVPTRKIYCAALFLIQMSPLQLGWGSSVPSFWKGNKEPRHVNIYLFPAFVVAQQGLDVIEGLPMISQWKMSM